MAVFTNRLQKHFIKASANEKKLDLFSINVYTIYYLNIPYG